MLHTHEVTGSSPVVSTKKKPIHSDGFFFLVEGENGLEPISIRQSGGLSIAAGLDGGDTLISSSPVVSVIPPNRQVRGLAYF